MGYESTTVPVATAPHRFFVLPLALVAAAASCGRPTPASAPLSEEAARPAPRRQTSSRAFETLEGTPAPQNEPEQIIEIDADPDDPGDSTKSGRGSAVLGGPGRGGTPGCTPSRGPAIDCAILGRGASCLGARLAERACETWAPSLDPKVGAAWLECMAGAKANASTACDTATITNCGLHAIEDACVDGSYSAKCRDIAAECAEMTPVLTQAVCERAISSFRPAQRAGIAECLRHGCETGAFGSCIP
jgi:hypothetical protein